MTIGTRLKQLRGDASLAEVGAKVGVGASGWLRWEQGTRVPDAESLACIARTFGVPLAVLLLEAHLPLNQPRRRELIALVERFGS